MSWVREWYASAGTRLEDSSEGIEIIDEDLALKHELGTQGLSCFN